MKVSRERAAENRHHVVEVASRLFRARGFDGVGIADLMKAAGLTHGGFYGQFNSKDDLATEASARAFENTAEAWEAVSRQKAKEPLAALVSFYLSEQHRDDMDTGCPLASLGVDSARHDGSVRRVFTEGLHRLLEILEGVEPGRTRRIRHRRALATMATMVGALVLARAADDDKLSIELIEVVRDDLINRQADI
jgi:TetR/AcrR family transcriptional repressor of nem operon